jgi:hypothetical protein
MWNTHKITLANCEFFVQFMVSGSEMCVSWDFGVQQWTPDGCSTSVGQGGIVTCRCNHLTNFAVLVV